MAPQHDAIISNASGAAVRADLNNALAALITNSSGATEPASTYAYQFWADTTTGQLKIRNAANSALHHALGARRHDADGGRQFGGSRPCLRVRP